MGTICKHLVAAQTMAWIVVAIAFGFGAEPAQAGFCENRYNLCLARCEVRGLNCRPRCRVEYRHCNAPAPHLGELIGRP
jgi:hypothetical protein